jgi:hypothetical protein
VELQTFHYLCLRDLENKMMKTNFILCATCAALMLGSCGTYEGQGAYIGSGIGAVVGSSIGDLAGGWNGSDVGTIVGMAGGAVIGGAIGAQQDQQRQSDRTQIHHQGNVPDRYGSGDYSDDSYGYQGDQNISQDRQQDEGQNYAQVGSDESGFNSSNSGDDRIYDVNGQGTRDNRTDAPEAVSPSFSEGRTNTNASGYVYNPDLEIRNARFVDSDGDNQLSRNEVCKITFEIYNMSDHAMMDVVPMVVEADGNRHIYVSPSIHVEKIDAGRGIRYTAVVKADGGLRNGNARFCVSAVQGNRTVSKVSEFDVPTRAYQWSHSGYSSRGE